jgi:hypothetical protein
LRTAYVPYPSDLQPILGQALTQSLKTGDVKTAKLRAAEVNATFEGDVAKAREGVVLERPQPIQVAASVFTPSNPIIGRKLVKELAATYLRRRSDELRPGGFKFVPFSFGLLVSLYGTRQIGSLSRDDGRRFASLIAQLSPHVGKSFQNRALGLEQLVAKSDRGNITAQNQKRILSQVHHFSRRGLPRGTQPQARLLSSQGRPKGLGGLLCCFDRSSGQADAGSGSSSHWAGSCVLSSVGHAVRGSHRAVAGRPRLVREPGTDHGVTAV